MYSATGGVRPHPRHQRSRDDDSRDPMIRQPSGGRRRFSISSGSRARGFVWPVWPVHRKNAKRVMEWPRNAAAMPAGRDRQPATEQADAEGQQQEVAVATRAHRAASSACTGSPG